jgi:hypothetical protein
MQRNPKRRIVAKRKVKVERSAAGKVAAASQKSGGPALAIARPAPTPAQLDARQEAIKTKRKAPGPVRAAKSLVGITPADVPAVEPRKV